MDETTAHWINLALAKHHFARSNTFNFQREDCVTARFRTENRRQVWEWCQRRHTSALAAINHDGNQSCGPRAPRIILATTFARLCDNRNVFLFCHDYSLFTDVQRPPWERRHPACDREQTRCLR